MSRLISCGLGAAALSLTLSMNAAAATLAQQSGAFGIVTYDPEPKTGYEAWAEANGITGAWNGTSGGIYNVFRYVFGEQVHDRSSRQGDVASPCPKATWRRKMITRTHGTRMCEH